MKNFSFEESKELIEFIIYGKVQGVGYRLWLKRIADSMSVKGWVKNKSDGSVKGILCGSEKNIEEIIEACYEGPKFAKVERIKIIKKIIPRDISDVFVIK